MSFAFFNVLENRTDLNTSYNRHLFVKTDPVRRGILVVTELRDSELMDQAWRTWKAESSDFITRRMFSCLPMNEEICLSVLFRAEIFYTDMKTVNYKFVTSKIAIIK